MKISVGHLKQVISETVNQRRIRDLRGGWRLPEAKRSTKDAGPTYEKDDLDLEALKVPTETLANLFIRYNNEPFVMSALFQSLNFEHSLSRMLTKKISETIQKSSKGVSSKVLSELIIDIIASFVLEEANPPSWGFTNPTSWDLERDKEPRLSPEVLISRYVAGIERAQRLVPSILKKLEKFSSVNIKGQQDPTAPLGRFAFADKGNRKKPLPGGIIEPNTSLENDLLQQLNVHFSENIPIDDNAANKLQYFLKQGMYDDVLNEPKVGVVYRGMSVSISWLKKLLKIKHEEKKIPSKGLINVEFDYKPKRGSSSSWTMSRSVAKKYSIDPGGVSIIIHAELANNPAKFLNGIGGLYNLEDFSDYEHEKETIGLGTIKVSRIEWKIIV